MDFGWDEDFGKCSRTANKEHTHKSTFDFYGFLRVAMSCDRSKLSP